MSIEVSRTRMGTRFNEGARLLWQVMVERGWSQGELGRALDAKPGTLPRWLYGDTKPSWDWAVKLRDAFGIALEAWTLEPTAAFVPPAAREADQSGEHAALGSTGTEG